MLLDNRTESLNEQTSETQAPQTFGGDIMQCQWPITTVKTNNDWQLYVRYVLLSVDVG